MVRNLKLAIVAMAVLAAIGSSAASSAHAAEFKCEVAPCLAVMAQDGIGKQAHHVMLIKKGTASGVLTCNRITGRATMENKTASQLTFTEIAYDGCAVNGSPADVEMHGCDYLVKTTGELVIQCPKGEPMEIEIGSCRVEIPAQTLKGLTFNNINGNTEITMTMTFKNIQGSAGANCKEPLKFEKEEFTEGEYTTGNTILQGAEDLSGFLGAQKSLSIQ